jgi:twitching motility protein PilI
MEQSAATQSSAEPGTTDLFARLVDYERRSLAHDAGEAQRQQKISNWSGVGFRVGEHRLACRIDQIEEIIAPPPYTSIPGTRDWLLGIANVRGNLAPVSDFGWYLFGEPTIRTPRSRLILTRFQSRLAGLIVDEVLGQRHFHTDDLEPDQQWLETPLSGLVNQSFPAGDTRWGILELEHLEQRADFMNGAREDR